jgi:hypothetical protein
LPLTDTVETEQYLLLRRVWELSLLWLKETLLRREMTPDQRVPKHWQGWTQSYRNKQ